jgi:signal transduction histidine kinase
MRVEILPSIVSPTIGIACEVVEKDPDLFVYNALLAGLSPEIFSRVSRQIDVLTLAHDEIVFEENDPGNCLYLIAEGSVKISKRGRGGHQETLAYLPANDYFGEMALMDGGKRSAQATAVGNTVLGCVDLQTWALLLKLAPQAILSNFTRSVTQRLRANNQHFIEQMMRNERLSLLGTTVSSIAHDMNNPISCIMNACEVIRSTAHDELSEQLTAIIRDSVKSMEAMTRELVDYSRGETQLKRSLVSIPELVQQLEPEFVKCRVASDVQIDVGYGGSLMIDRHRMLRVFGNLVKNARDAMKAGDPNVLRFVVRELDSPQIQFEVSDTGHGIKSELLPKIFEPFVTEGKANGCGLGLAISKAVVEAHNGTITVRSSDAGTTFTITLPLSSKCKS